MSRAKLILNSLNNKLHIEDAAAHEWYRFVLSYPPHLVRAYAQRFGLNGSHCVLDPFCGTGTTMIECKKLGIPSVGIEANPMAHFASEVKVDWSPLPDGLSKHADMIASVASKRLESEGLTDSYQEASAFPAQHQSANEHHATYRTLPPECFKLLLTDSISPRPLHKALVLLDVFYRRLLSRKRIEVLCGRGRSRPE